MTNLTHSISAGVFKAQCLHLMDVVNQQHKTLTITKRGIPVARLVPIEKPLKTSRFGCMAGTIHIKGDITQPIDEEWDVLK
jgi:prevent-host-death family protein